MPDPLKKNREKFYYNKTGIDIQNPVTPERSYEIPFELKRSVPTHISREVLLHITGFTSDQRIEQKFSFEADPELARRQPKAVRSACERSEHVP